VLLFDQKGKQVAAKQVNMVEGNNTVKIAGLQQLAAGVYMLQVATDTQVLQHKLVKLP
jgi:methionine-rich copper-binding protein CopC